MKIGVFSDAHANAIGLGKCLDFLVSKANVDRLFFLGDAVGYFTGVNEVISTLGNNDITCLLGNHDAMLLGKLPYDESKNRVYNMPRNKKDIEQQHLSFLSTLSPRMELEVDRVKMLFLHGSPENPLNGYVYPDSDLTGFQNLPHQVVFMGHTHRPFVKRAGEVLAVNVGSCGLPRDNGNLLSCAIYDTETGEAVINRIPMNIDEVIEKYGGSIHQTVIECLNRKSKPIIGQLVH